MGFLIRVAFLGTALVSSNEHQISYICRYRTDQFNVYMLYTEGVERGGEGERPAAVKRGEFDLRRYKNLLKWMELHLLVEEVKARHLCWNRQSSKALHW